MQHDFKEKNAYPTNTILCTFLVLVIGLLSACDVQQTNQQAQQQHFVCKSLIDGFLKAGNLGHYTLQKIQPILNDTATERAYVYAVADDYLMKLNVPRQQKLKFNCQYEGTQRYTVQLFNPEHQRSENLISLDLPTQNTIQTLTAFALKNQ